MKINLNSNSGSEDLNATGNRNGQVADNKALYHELINGSAGDELLSLQKQLQEKSKQLEQMTVFAMEGDCPKLKIDKNGLVLMANKAASALTCFKYGNAEITAAGFWPLVVLQAVNPGKNVSAQIDGTTFNFYLNPSGDGDSFIVNGYPENSSHSFVPDQKNADVYLQQEAAIASLRNKGIAGDLQLKLSQTASRLRALLGNMHAGVLVEDEFGNISLVNKTFCELFNLSKNPAELEGVPANEIYDIIASQFQNTEEFINGINNIIRQRKNQVNQKLVRADGKVYIRHFIANIGDSNEYFGHMSLYRDITDVIKLENDLADQRKFYESILNSLPADIAVFDKEQRYQFLNPVAIPEADIRSWVIGKTDKEYCHLRSRPAEMSSNRGKHFWEAVKTKMLVSYEEEITHEDGLTKSYLRNFYPVVNEHGEISQVILYGIDITGRKEFEQTVRISEKRYRDLINNNQALIITHDLAGKITSINPAVTDTLGFTAEEMLGCKLTHFLSEDAKSIFETEYLNFIKKEKRIEGVFKIESKTGAVFYMLFKNILFSEEGNEPYVIAFAQDISKRVRAEKNLEAARLETEKIAKSKQRFIANMSHEIRTPMNGIIGITNLLAQTPLNGQQAEYVNLVNQSADNLLVIVNDILDLEKIVSGKLNLECITFLLQEKVRMIYEAFRFQAQEKRVSLQLDYNVPSGLWVKGDPHRLTQVLNNLLGNALKFTNQGSVRMVVSVNNEADGKVITEFSIIDTGIGISRAALGDIFEPYVQERSETARKFGGTGLGLPISKNLVEILGGKMKVESQQGKGSAFTFTIPFLKSGPVKNVVNIDAQSHEMMRGRKVLVAEDVPVNQYLVKHILKSWGCVFAIASNGLEALQLLEQQDWDIVLMDIQMPVMDGLEATQKIRTMPDSKKAVIPIIALTANALNGDEIKYREAGMNGYLAKPYTEKALYTVVCKVMADDKQGTNTKASIKPEPIAKKPTEIINKDPLLYNLQMLEDMSGGDREFVNMMAELFMNTTPPILNELKEAINNGDWQLAGAIAHKLKPTIESMGIQTGTLMINEIETLSKQQTETTLIPVKVNEFIAVINVSMGQMRQYLSHAV